MRNYGCRSKEVIFQNVVGDAKGSRCVVSQSQKDSLCKTERISIVISNAASAATAPVPKNDNGDGLTSTRILDPKLAKQLLPAKIEIRKILHFYSMQSE